MMHVQMYRVGIDKCIERQNIRYSHKFEKCNETFHIVCIQFFVGWLEAYALTQLPWELRG